jgi:hypothetical protein
MGVPVVVGDRVLVTTATTGTGTYDLGSAVNGYLAPDAGTDESPSNPVVVSGSRVAYVVVDSLTNPTLFEVGEGTYTAGTPATISRTLIVRNSSGGTSAISWSAGTKYIFLAPSASRFVMYDSDGNFNLSTPITIGNGTASAVAVSPVNDRDTGMYFPGENRVALATNGVSRIEFNATGAALFNSSHGTNGQFLKTNGSTTAPTWVSVTPSDIGAVAKSGDTMTGALYASGALGVYGSAGTERIVQWATGVSTRWQMVANSTAESGANAGSDLVLRSYSDAGVLLGSVFEVTRSTRKQDFKVTPSVNGSDIVKKDDFTTTVSTNGSMVMPNNLIMKWGGGATSNGAANVAFATAFPNACFNVQLTISGGDGAQTLNSLKVGTIATTGFNAYGPAGTSYAFYWFAIGH